MSVTRYTTFFYSSTITVFSTHMFTSASKYLRATRKKKAQQMDMEQKQRLGNVIHGFFATFHYFNGVFGCLLFIYFMPLHDHHFFTFSSRAFCSTVSRYLTARAPTHHPIRHAMQRGARGGHPSLRRFWPRAFHVCPLPPSQQ